MAKNSDIYTPNIVVDATDYDEFMKENRRIINRYINTVLWFCIFTGPAIAVGIFYGVFNAASYSTCVVISASMIVVAFIHRQIIRVWPYARSAGLIAFLCMEVLLVLMSYNHIHVNITWFFVPFLSTLFCEKRLFIITVSTNYLAMVISTYLISFYNADIISVYSTNMEFFANTLMGYTIETAVMTASGLAIIRIVSGYFADLIQKNRATRTYATQIRAQMDVLYSMSEVYDYVNLIDFKAMTELSIKDGEQAKPLSLGDHAHSLMNHHIKESVDKEQLEDFWDFTNLKTLKNRLYCKRFIYGEYINVKTGWFRAQYINIEEDEKGFPSLIVYTVQNINMDKRREENLIKIYHTDDLTKVFNRRCLEYDLSVYNSKPIEDDLVIASVDINRLKYTNDTFGHAAGDELICAAANALSEALGDSGKVYRTGGDEFTLVIHTKNISAINDEIKKNASAWTGSYGGKLAISIGYASHRDNPEVGLDRLKVMADSLMYEDKNRYYKRNGYERRAKEF
ncbi:GGDEF domain-containing protein [Butyrivibrio sp.]|uniref:GGDEF domain-containing protein n=1 Tax=Butyrivibrio sp. TaxID=28121 RepID=UPI0025BD9962|nr:GGDEF domain-containing protein [Butyrivibrio sp.]MBQ9303859.1 GGDEF domain-containing protein [Butyrivibrio sp.]